jgi:hypothetical protein
MSDTRYNGWTNYETWVVNLWMDNEEGSHDYWVSIAQYIYEHEAEEQKHFSRMEDAVCLLSEQLKEDHEEAKDEILSAANLSASVWADLLGAALSAANWREIAEHLMENVEVTA